MSSSRDRHKGKGPAPKKTPIVKPKPINFTDDSTYKKPKDLILISENDSDKIIEMGKLVEKGELMMGGYATGKFLYWKK